ncbi:MAG: hypothetical protein GWP67_07135 [Gammaproteobacteria bacterium]|nr:hypothetical protein [Gammaproteobacteria bacterium]
MSTYPKKFYFKLFTLHLRQNGVLWTLRFCVKHVLVEVLRVSSNGMGWLERKYDLPGSFCLPSSLPARITGSAD